MREPGFYWIQDLRHFSGLEPVIGQWYSEDGDNYWLLTGSETEISNDAIKVLSPKLEAPSPT